MSGSHEDKEEHDEQQLRQEAVRFALRYTCEDCVYFLPDGPPGHGCVHGYPNGEHLRRERGPIVFCKEFELR